MTKRPYFSLAALAALLLFPLMLFADGANFDLDGPALHVRVTRGNQTLDIGQVPNLLGGDKLWIQPAFPAGQAARYLLIVSFLRGATNPPPEDWFIKAETWNDTVRGKGLTLTIPHGAEQALLMLAPVTGGDFTTLRNAVRGRPGTFVRAVQDLQQASLQRSRLDKYLTAVQTIAANDPNDLRKEAPLLAKSLKIKLDADCFEKPADQQAECLTQNSNNLLLDDGSTQSMVAELTSGANTDLIGQISSTRMAGGGAYSPYVGAVVDMVKIFGNLMTAKYQYIPAISVQEGERLGLKLNNPPSFHDPKSVIVIGLPPIGASHLPVLIAPESQKLHCLQDSAFVLPVEGAPLLFSTGYGRNLRLQMKDAAGKPIELPVSGDARRGGLVLAGAKSLPPGIEGNARLKGLWGFDSFEGPIFQLLSASEPGNWKLRPEDAGQLLAGKADTVHLLSREAGCSEKITLAADPAKSLTWKADKPGEIELQLPLENVKPGKVALEIKQFGFPKAETISLLAYSNDVKLEGFNYHSGDTSLDVSGAHLEQLSSLKLEGIRFLPAEAVASGNELTLKTQGDASALKPANAQTAEVLLRDGRTLELKGVIEPPRPRVTLLDKDVLPAPSGDPLAFLRLGDPNDLPVNGTLTFFVKTATKFNRLMKLEIATDDDSASVQLGFSDGGLILQDATTARAELNPGKSFGPSVFGELRFRALDGSGGKGDWQPLTRLVRLPKITRIVCPENVSQPCHLEGSDLFLIDSLSSDEKFTSPVVVSEGFAGTSISVPRPNGTLLYVKLRDAPGAINHLLAPVFPEQ
ncbi:MAG: hypothetical protein ACHQIK_06620 [Candidatus Acidiferrales bacterium]